MANFGILAKLGVDASTMAAGLLSGKRKMSDFGKHIKKVMKLAVIAGGAAITAFAVKGVGDFMNFEKKMAEAFTLIPDASKEMRDKLTKDMRNLAKTMGIDLIEATEGLYGALSAGVPPENVISFLEQASKTAIGGVTDLGSAVGATTTVMNAYKLGQEDMARVSDALFSIVQGGETTFGELSKHIGKVTKISSTLGITIEELAASARIMTLAFGKGNTAEAMTALKVGFTELGDSGSKVGKIFESVAKSTFMEFKAAGGTLEEALRMLSNAAGGSEEKLKEMFTSTEAGMAIMKLAADSGNKFGKELKIVQANAGAMEAAYQELAKTTSQQWNKMKSSLTDLGITMGAALMPLVNAVLPALAEAFSYVAEAVGTFVDFVKENPALLKTLTTIMKVFVATLVSVGALMVANAVSIGIATVAAKAYNAVVIFSTKALKALNMVVKVSPFGALVSILTLAAVAITAFGDASEDAAKRAKEATAEVIQEEEKRSDALSKSNLKLLSQIEAVKKAREKRKKTKEIEESGLDEQQTALELAKLHTAELIKQQEIDVKAQMAATDKLERLKEGIKIVEEEIKAGKRQGDQSQVIATNKRLQHQTEKEILELTLKGQKAIDEIALSLEEIARIQAQSIKDEKERLQALANLKKAVGDVRREHELSQTELGQIVLKTERLNELQEAQRKIQADLDAGRKVSKEDIDSIAKSEKEILDIQKEIADILENKVQKAIEAELEGRRKSIELLDEEIAPLKKISDYQKDILKRIKQQLDVQRDKVAEAEKEAAIFDKFRGDVDKFGQKKGVGGLGLKSSELRREFRLLKQEGKNFREATQEDVDAGKARNVGDKIRIRNQREFQKHVEGQMAKADKKAKEEKAIQDQLIEDGKEAAKKKAAADKEMAELAKKKKDEQEALLKAENDLLDREEKTIKELTDARIKLEKALKDFRDGAIGGQVAQAPALGAVMAGLGVRLGNAGGQLGEAAAPADETSLYEMNMKPTEDELVEANKTLTTMNTTLAGKFVNQ